MVTWAAVYVLVGEAQPGIWLLPTVVLLVVLVAVGRLSLRATPTLPR
jgi:hypothetical protein